MFNVWQYLKWRVFYWEKAPTRIFPTLKSFLVYSATILKTDVEWRLFCLNRFIKCESSIGCYLIGQGAISFFSKYCILNSEHHFHVWGGGGTPTKSLILDTSRGLFSNVSLFKYLVTTHNPSLLIQYVAY